jgi:hypothetical protein
MQNGIGKWTRYMYAIPMYWRRVRYRGNREVMRRIYRGDMEEIRYNSAIT